MKAEVTETRCLFIEIISMPIAGPFSLSNKLSSSARDGPEGPNSSGQGARTLKGQCENVSHLLMHANASTAHKQRSVEKRMSDMREPQWKYLGISEAG